MIKQSKLVLVNILKSLKLWAALILMLFLSLFYRDVLFGGRTFLIENGAPGTLPYPPGGPYKYTGINPGFTAIDPGAIAWIEEPLNRFISNSIKQGDFPLWNPYSGPAGAPLFADGVTAPLEPIQFLFSFIPVRFWPFTIDIQFLLRSFIAGFFTYLFSRRLKIGFLGSLSAGLFFMLGSYFVMYGDHPQFKAEALLPAVLYGYERLSSSEDKKGPWICSLFIGWVLIAGMPESVFFILVLGTLWYFHRMIINSAGNKINFGSLKVIFIKYIVFTALGFLISAIFLLPVIEFILLARSIHLSTNSNTTLPIWLLTNLIYQGFPGGFLHIRVGFIPIFAIIYSILSVKDWPDYRRVIIFFCTYILSILFVLFNFPFTGWILNLPILRSVVIYKYAFPSILFASAIVTGIFIHKIKIQSLTYMKVSIALVIILLFIFWLPSRSDPTRSFSIYYLNQYFGLLAFILIGCSAMTLVAFAFLAKNHRIDYFLPKSLRLSQSSYLQGGYNKQFVLLFLLLTEPFLWSFLISRPIRTDPFQPPPFIDYLKKDITPFRIFGMDQTLYPNISTAYNIADIRWLYALAPQRAYDFSTSLIVPDDPQGIRFTGQFLPISDRMFDLLNVKYVLENNFVLPTSSYVNDCPTLPNDISGASNQPDLGSTLDYQILAQNRGSKDLFEQRININNAIRLAISAPAPTTFKLELSIPEDVENLNFSIGLSPDSFQSDLGDGVNFKVDLSDGGNTTNLFAKYINPKSVPCDRKWIDESLNLQKWAGQDVALSFTTNVRPSGHDLWDLPYWGNISISNSASDAKTSVSTNLHYTKAYQDKNVTIFQNNQVLPRSFVVYRVIHASNFNESIKLLSDPAFDLKNTAVIENLPADLAALINQNPPGSQFVPAKAKLVSSGEMDIKVQTNAPGLLVLSDQYYPGWNVWVDGKPSHIYATDGTFRGVFLDKGTHKVQFKFEPLSFLVGGIISILSLIATFLGIFIKHWVPVQ